MSNSFSTLFLSSSILNSFSCEGFGGSKVFNFRNFSSISFWIEACFFSSSSKIFSNSELINSDRRAFSWFSIESISFVCESALYFLLIFLINAAGWYEKSGQTLLNSLQTFFKNIIFSFSILYFVSSLIIRCSSSKLICGSAKEFFNNLFKILILEKRLLILLFSSAYSVWTCGNIVDILIAYCW